MASDKLVFPLNSDTAIKAELNRTISINGALNGIVINGAGLEEDEKPIDINGTPNPCDCNGCENGKISPLTSEPADAKISDGQLIFYFTSQGPNFQNNIQAKWKTTTGIVRSKRIT